LKKQHDITNQEIGEWLFDASVPPIDETTVNQTEDALILFAETHSVAPPAALRHAILDKIKGLNEQRANHQQLDVNELPLLNEESKWLEWSEAVAGIEPPADFEDIHMHTLESNAQRDLFVIWVKEFVPEEVHHDLLESFMILEGSCVCYITDQAGETRIVRLGEGDFITMQLEETHDIHVTSEKPAKAILQWYKLAA
jgi:mannose-6-phosphate isomerase-like protein (cupin superfamily)